MHLIVALQRAASDALVRCSTLLVARLEAWDRAFLGCAGRIYHQTCCAQLLEEALRIHAAEQALGSEIRFVCELHLVQAAGPLLDLARRKA